MLRKAIVEIEIQRHDLHSCEASSCCRITPPVTPPKGTDWQSFGAAAFALKLGFSTLVVCTEGDGVVDCAAELGDG